MPKPVEKLTIHLREGVDLNIDLFPPRAASGMPGVAEKVSITVNEEGVADLDLRPLAKDLAC
jgi:hypothetical protein